jgi:hypothetical protein
MLSVVMLYVVMLSDVAPIFEGYPPLESFCYRLGFRPYTQIID